MYYWLVESKTNPSTDPLLIWFNGGPGCSSFGGAFEEMGPFYVGDDGSTLYENKYSWNYRANLLFIESPIGVGFSYSTTNFTYAEATDDQTCQMNYLALKDFFSSYPNYSNRSFFLSGESYAGVYVPTLTLALAKGINSGDFLNKNFQGSNIGNGYMHVEYLYNSQVIWSAYHAMVSVEEMQFLKKNCTTPGATVGDLETYNFVDYMITIDGLEYESDGSKCGDLIEQLVNMPEDQDEYNYYQDCYMDSPLDEYKKSSLNRRMQRKTKKNRKREHLMRKRMTRNRVKRENPAEGFNYGSTDTEYGYPCWNELLLTAWAKRPEVLKALHIDQAWQDAKLEWQDCNDPMYDGYNVTYRDLTPIFEEFLKINTNPSFRFLIHNGDVDTVCNYLGDAWFMKRLADRNGMKTSKRKYWYFSEQTAGYIQTYTAKSGVIFDLMTVKGAGHFPSTDRPGPARQFIVNFMWTGENGKSNYSSEEFVDRWAEFSPLEDAKSGFSQRFLLSLAFIVVRYLPKYLE